MTVNRIRITRRLLMVMALLCACEARYSPGDARLTTDETDRARKPALRLRLEKLSSIGELQGESKRVFGAIEDAMLMSGRRFAILDSKMYELRIFDFDGRVLAFGGREGTGPGDLANPRELERTNGADLLVLDSGRGILRWARTDSAMVESRSISTKVWGYSFCRLNNRLFVYALRDNRIVHEISWDGNVVRSFGDVYIPDYLKNDALAYRSRYTFFVGSIACFPEEHLIIQVAATRPAVTAFTSEGAVAWTTEVPGFHELRVYVEPPDRTIFMGEGKTGWHHYIGGLTVLPTGMIAVQVKQAGVVPAGVDRTAVETYVFDPANGHLAGYGTDLPLLMDVSREYALAKVKLPYPAIAVYRVVSGH